MSYAAAVITVSDKGSRGERTDTSGPALCSMLEQAGWQVVHTALVPDQRQAIEGELIRCADEKAIPLVLTTGGTGFSPRDVTPEATLAVAHREAPGIPEAMRAESMKITSRGCLSRGRAVIRNRTLIVNLPGSEKAARENLLPVLDALEHGVKMLLGSGSAECAADTPKLVRRERPSLDQWLREAKAAPDAPKAGMYLFHNGVVRESAKARVREGAEDAPSVTAMDFSYDRDKLNTLLALTRAMPGICYARAWLNEGRLGVGEDLMLVLVGGDIRPNVVDALQFLVGGLKRECVREQELY